MDYSLLALTNIILLVLLIMVVSASVILAYILDIRLTVSSKNRKSAPESKTERNPEKDAQAAENERKPETGAPADLPAKSMPAFGRSVLILGGSAEKAHHYINDAFEEDFLEIVYSRTEPDILRAQYPFRKNVTFFWINHREEGDFQIGVNDISKISWNLKQVISNLKKAIIFIDCIDYIVFINGFPHVLRVINELIDNISKLEISLVLWIDPRAIDEKELTLLRRSLHTVIEEERKK